jgi:hypothetical protein
LFHTSLFRLGLESYMATALISILALTFFKRGTVETPSGIVGKKRHARPSTPPECIVS